MIGFGSIGSTVKVVAISAAVLAAISAFWYISGLRADLQQSIANVETLKTSVQEQKNAIARMREEQAQIRQINEELRAVDREQQKEVESLRRKFDTTAAGKSRDFARLAARKPGLVENSINNGTADAFRCLEIASGDDLTEEEINATSKSEANTVCPSIANPNYDPD
jgi:ABC-type lipoprotein release transport system permease subunit